MGSHKGLPSKTAEQDTGHEEPPRVVWVKGSLGWTLRAKHTWHQPEGPRHREHREEERVVGNEIQGEPTNFDDLSLPLIVSSVWVGTTFHLFL